MPVSHNSPRTVSLVVIYSGWPYRILRQAVSSRPSRPQVEERVHIDLVVENSDSSSYNQIPVRCRLVSKAEAWRNIVMVGRENRTNAISLNEQTPVRSKHGQVLGQAVEWSDVFVA